MFNDQLYKFYNLDFRIFMKWHENDLHNFAIITWNHSRICMFGVMGYIHANASFEVILFDNLKDIQAFSISNYAMWYHSYDHLYMNQILKGTPIVKANCL